MVTRPLNKVDLIIKINEIDKQMLKLQLQKQKYESDLRYYTDKEYRKRETIYKWGEIYD